MTACEPLVALLPLQAPDEVQLVALVVLQVKVDEAPLATVVGLALKVRVGAGGGVVVTVTVVDALAEPPEPLQDNVKLLVAASAGIDCDPLVALPPLQAPDAVQLVALVVLHVKVELLPLVTDEGLDVSETVGAGVATETSTDFAVLPPLPVHVSVNVFDELIAPVEALPVTGLAPLHPPDAVQDWASVLLHVRVDDAPLVTLVGLADIETAGRGSGPEFVPPDPPPQAASASALIRTVEVCRSFIAVLVRGAARKRKSASSGPALASEVEVAPLPGAQSIPKPGRMSIC